MRQAFGAGLGGRRIAAGENLMVAITVAHHLAE